jgi:hypothetical protein
MNELIKNRYGIKFENVIFERNQFGKEIHKMIDINIFSLGVFLMGWNKPDKIDQRLLPDIYDVLNGVSDLRENASPTMQIEITPIETVFYDNRAGYDFPRIPTADFKEIVEAWRDFLLDPPLDRSKIT